MTASPANGGAKVLIFAHTPPPHHGQSQMVEHLVRGLADGSRGVAITHVDARLSDGARDIGAARPGKIFAVFMYVLRAWTARFRTGVRVFYYVPSPPKRASLYRDWIVMALCRPLFPRLVLHWHAVGLGEWLEKEASGWERAVTRLLLGRAWLSIVLSPLNAADAGKLAPKSTAVVVNGIPDPCPHYAAAIAPVRAERAVQLAAAARPGGPAIRAKALFLALCSRDKGVLDAVEAVRLANETLEASGAGLRFDLQVAGMFVDDAVRAEFDALAQKAGGVTVAGFLEPDGKAAAFKSADVFLFPSYFANEGQPLVLAESMAWGVPPVTTRWRGIPEMPPPGWPGLVEPRDPKAAAEALVRVAVGGLAAPARARFEEMFLLEGHLDQMAAALRRAAGDGGAS
jgi:glycosyltransferase involved in cell wall biosynthesis